MTITETYTLTACLLTLRDLDPNDSTLFRLRKTREESQAFHALLLDVNSKQMTWTWDTLTERVAEVCNLCPQVGVDGPDYGHMVSLKSPHFEVWEAVVHALIHDMPEPVHAMASRL